MRCDPTSHISRGIAFLNMMWLACLAQIFVLPLSLIAEDAPAKAAVEKRVEELVGQARTIKSTELTDHLKGVLEELTKVEKLSAEDSASLSKFTDESVRAALDQWTPAVTRTLKAFFARDAAEAALGKLKHWRAEEIAAHIPVKGSFLPDEWPAWQEQAKSVLGPARWSDWEKAVAAKRETLDREIAAYVKTWAEKDTTAFQAELTDQIGDLKNALSLAADREQALINAAKADRENLVKDWIAEGTPELRAMPEVFRKEFMSQGYDPFFLQAAPLSAATDPTWQKSLSKLLSEKEITTWKNKNSQDENDLVQTVKGMCASGRELIATNLKAKATSIAQLAGLAPERAKALEKAADAVADKMAADWEKVALENMKSQSRDEREQTMKQNSMGVNFASIAVATGVFPGWDKSIDETLTPEEKKRWKNNEQADLSRESACIARLIIMKMDEKVCLSAEQRTKLEPLLEKVTERVSPKQAGGPELSEDLIFAWAKMLKEDQLKPILDAAQWKRWQESRKASPLSVEQDGSAPLKLPPPRKSETPGRKPEPESVDSVITGYLSVLWQCAVDAQMTTMQPNVDEVVRIGGLSDRDHAKLLTAAKGAAELSLKLWMQSTASSVFSYTQSATPQSIRERLRGMESWYTRRTANTAEQPLWHSMVARLLPPERREEWQKSSKDREEYRRQAQVGMVISELRQKCPELTREKAARLEPHLSKILKEYSEDIDAWLSQPWYLSSYYRLIPLAGVSDQDLKESLGPDTAKKVSQVASEGSQYWESILRNHRNRRADRN